MARFSALTDAERAAACVAAFAPLGSLKAARRGPSLARDDWYGFPANVATLVHWAIQAGFSHRDLAYLTSKPWKYRAEFVVAYCTAVDGRQEGSAA